MIRLRWFTLSLIACLVLTSGCRKRSCCKQDNRSVPRPIIGIGPPMEGTPRNIPATEIPNNARFDPSRSEYLYPSPPPDRLPDSKPSGSPNSANGNSSGKLLAPEPSISESSTNESAPKPNSTNESDANIAQSPRLSIPASPPPPRASEGGTTDTNSIFPVGIAEFAQVKDDVTTGLQPDLSGLNWLEKKQYKTVLFLRKPTENDASHRKQVEDKRGITFLSLEVSPSQINEAKIAEFNKIVADQKGRPLFVYDKDGSITGSLWYAHLRSVEGFGKEQARVRAGSLGFRPEASAEHRAMADAVENALRSID